MKTLHSISEISIYLFLDECIYRERGREGERDREKEKEWILACFGMNVSTWNTAHSAVNIEYSNCINDKR